jgi:hypothetical protein
MISISIKNRRGSRSTAYYAFPDFEFTECAFDELRTAARRFTELANEGRHACSARKLKTFRKQVKLANAKS